MTLKSINHSIMTQRAYLMPFSPLIIIHPFYRKMASGHRCLKESFLKSLGCFTLLRDMYKIKIHWAYLMPISPLSLMTVPNCHERKKSLLFLHGLYTIKTRINQRKLFIKKCHKRNCYLIVNVYMHRKPHPKKISIDLQVNKYVFCNVFDILHWLKTFMLYRNTKVKVRSPDGDTDHFDIVAGVLQGDTLAQCMFIICLNYGFRTPIDKMKNNGLKLTKERSSRYSAQTITDVDYADNIALLANTPTQA